MIAKLTGTRRKEPKKKDCFKVQSLRLRFFYVLHKDLGRVQKKKKIKKGYKIYVHQRKKINWVCVEKDREKKKKKKKYVVCGMIVIN
jgi:hypothetical protein